VERWKKKDPIPRFETYLTERGLLNDEMKRQITGEITAEIDEAVDFAENSPYPAAEEAAQFVWS